MVRIVIVRTVASEMSLLKSAPETGIYLGGFGLPADRLTSAKRYSTRENTQRIA